MRITVSAYKGGVGKTTTAMHFASILGEQSPTLLVDLDRVPASWRWHERGDSWSFDAIRGQNVTAEQLQRYSREGHVVFDTPAAPSEEQLVAFGQRSDVLVIPSSPDQLALEALIETLVPVQKAKIPHAVLLTLVPPRPSKDGERARATLQRAGIAVLSKSIPRAAAFRHAARQATTVDQVRRPGTGALAWLYRDALTEAVSQFGGKK